MKTLTIGKLAALILSIVFSVTAVAIAVPAVVVSVREAENTQTTEENGETLTDSGEASDEPSKAAAAPVETTKKPAAKKAASSSEFLVATDADFNALEKLLQSNDTFTANYDCTSSEAGERVLYRIAGLFGVYDKYFSDSVWMAKPNDNYIPDPLNKYSEWGYKSYPAANVDYIAKNIFNTTIEHREYRSIYYYDGRVYAEDTVGGKETIETPYVTSWSLRSDGKYDVNVTIDIDDFIKIKKVPCKMTVALKNLDGKRVWSFYQVESGDM